MGPVSRTPVSARPPEVIPRSVRVGSQLGGVTPQSGCPDGSVFQNMILSK
jgi:hypothetical protein